MKKIKNKYHLLVTSFLTTLLGFLGVSCDNSVPVLYGLVYDTNYVDLNGEVTNEDGQPLESMQVRVNRSYMRRLVDTLYTNSSGEFEQDYAFTKYSNNDTLFIEVNDTLDVYASEKVEIPFTEMTKVSESEYSTEYSVDVKFQLKKK
jgi:putative lipoprotein (rSAM/lipoprotein system)